MKIIYILQILVSVIYVVNKMMVLAENKKGWLLGAIAACLAVIYFSLLGLFVYTALNVGLIILMGYGFVKGKKKIQRWKHSSGQ